MCLHAAEKYKKVESINTKNDFETAAKSTDKTVLTRPNLMTYIIFPIQLNFPITSRCVLKAIYKKKMVNCFMLLEKVFFSKRGFYDIVQACCI